MTHYADTNGNVWADASAALDDFLADLPYLTDEETETVFQFTRYDADAASNLAAIAHGIVYAGLSDRFDGDNYPVPSPAYTAETLDTATTSALATLAWTTHAHCLNRTGVNAVCYACATDCECIVCDGNSAQLPEMVDAWDCDWTPDAVASIRADVADFLASNVADLADLTPEQIGHDFILTRNRHGAGFWDRGLGERGDRLTDAAHAYGSVNAYIDAADIPGETFTLAIA